jgi:hypothetical protein
MVGTFVTQSVGFKHQVTAHPLGNYTVEHCSDNKIADWDTNLLGWRPMLTISTPFPGGKARELNLTRMASRVKRVLLHKMLTPEVIT